MNERKRKKKSDSDDDDDNVDDNVSVYNQLPEYTRIAKYAQYNREEKRRETWKEQIDRVFKMHKVKFQTHLDNPEFMDVFNFAKKMVERKGVLGSQRALQFGGPAILNKETRMYNCFSGDTKFWTLEGLKPFNKFEDGSMVMVRTYKKWIQGTVKKFGQEELFKLSVEKNGIISDIYTTSNHRWISMRENQKKFGIKSSVELNRGDILQQVCLKTKPWPNMCPVGIQHGIMFGGGTYDKINNYYNIKLCGKNLELKKFFYFYYPGIQYKNKEDIIIGELPNNYTKLPSLDMTEEYLYGFLAGLFAVNGLIDETGLILSNSNKKVLNWLQIVFFRLGIMTGKIKLLNMVFQLSIENKSITQDFFLNSKHFDTKTEIKDSYSYSHCKVISIESTNRKEDVWCIVEPEYEEFTLESGIVTKNCCATYVDRVRVFQEIMFSLLCGVGVGFSVQKHHIAKLPSISAMAMEMVIGLKSEKYEVQDSIEGWSDAIGVLCSCYFSENQTFPEYYGKQVEFDFSLIRPAGATISYMGGKAPGPDGLSASLKKIKEVFENCLEKGYGRLRTIDAYDIIVHSSDAVLSGGIRRSACISLFSLDDDDMIKAKTGDWYIKNPQRARSNNSALLLRDKTPEKQYMDLIESVKQFGEPGIIWSDSTECLYNPCVPDDTWVLTSQGSRQVKDLLGVPFTAIVDGKEYECKTGFIKTGYKQLYKIITQEGFEVRATENHKILTADREWIELKDLIIGDKITVNDHSERKITINPDSDDFAKGWLIGSLYGNGIFHFPSKNVYLCYGGTGKYIMKDIANKYIKQLTTQETTEVSDWGTEKDKIILQNKFLFKLASNYIVQVKKLLSTQIENESLSFQSGFLRGWFDYDGLIEKESIHLSSNNIDSLKLAQRICTRLGIYGIISKEISPCGNRMIFNEKGGSKLFYCKAIHELIISKFSMKMYQKNIGFNEPEKLTQLNKILLKYKRRSAGYKYTAEIINIVTDNESDVYDCTVDDIHAFDANGLYVHNCVEISLYGYDSKGNSGFQFCVSGHTNLITKNGKNKILQVVGKNISIWNGKKWCGVIPFETSKNIDLYRVAFSDGSYLDCTLNHKFKISNKFMKNYKEVTTKDLITIIKTSIFNWYVPPSNIIMEDENCINENYAYEYGVYFGNKCLTNFSLIKNKFIYFKTLDNKFLYKLKHINEVPSEIYNWTKKSINDFIYGWIFSNGKKFSKKIIIYGTENKIRDLQLLLTKIGVNSNIKQKNYINLLPRWFATLPNLLKSSPGGKKYQIIKCIKKLEGKHNAYCLEEKDEHMCMFNNVMTMQCNLTEINMSTVDTPEEFYDRCKTASILGTFQAAYTNFGYLGKVTEDIVKREALLGVSMTGMMDSPNISFDPVVLERGANVVKEVNEKVAKIIGINKASRTTCIKPAGTTSCILGTSSGIHPCHSNKYFRRVQSNNLEEPLKFFKKYNPQAVEMSVWSAGKTDEVITFLCKSKPGALTRVDISAIGLLEKVKLVQKHWVTAGKNNDCCVQSWLNHNVSNTITIKKEEWNSTAKFIYDNRAYFAGISMLGDSGDMTYHQAPFQAIYTPREIIKMYGEGSIFASGLISHANDAFDNNLYAACATLLEYGEKLEMTDKIDKKVIWITQAKKFAKNYFTGDILKMTYCLKSIDSFKTWCDLKRTSRHVPWKKFIEEIDNTKSSEYIACSGNSCEIINF